MIARSNARDARPSASLTHERAVDLAERVVREDGPPALVSLARWVLRWAPVVAAAERQEAAWEALPREDQQATLDNLPEVLVGWMVSTAELEDAVRAAQEGGGS